MLKTIVDFCEQFKEDIINFQFSNSDGEHRETPINNYYCFTPRYQSRWEVLNGISQIIDMFGIDLLDDNANFFRKQVFYLSTNKTLNKDIFFEGI